MTRFVDTEKALNDFGKYVVQQSRSRLSKGKHNYTKELYNSLSYNIVEDEQGSLIQFFMEEYGEYQDQGVKGVKKVYPESSKSPFSYKPTSKLIGLEYKTGVFSDWARYRGIQPRNKKSGRFGSYKTMGYILATLIKKKGIRATGFFTKSFELAVKRLPAELLETFTLDVESGIVLIINKEI